MLRMSRALFSVSLAVSCSAFAPSRNVASRRLQAAANAGVGGDLTGKVAFIAGVADSTGYGWAIAKALSEAGAKIVVGTWPPVLNIFKASLDKGKLDADRARRPRAL